MILLFLFDIFCKLNFYVLRVISQKGNAAAKLIQFQQANTDTRCLKQVPYLDDRFY